MVFQLAHAVCLIELQEVLNTLTSGNRTTMGNRLTADRQLAKATNLQNLRSRMQTSNAKTGK
jgi:hypothetical protein